MKGVVRPERYGMAISPALDLNVGLAKYREIAYILFPIIKLMVNKAYNG